jgi:hypothetical protein
MGWAASSANAQESTAKVLGAQTRLPVFIHRRLIRNSFLDVP